MDIKLKQGFLKKAKRISLPDGISGNVRLNMFGGEYDLNIDKDTNKVSEGKK